MLVPAQFYADEIKTALLNTWYVDKYKYYHNNSFFDEVEIENTTWNRHQFAAVDKNNTLRGYISYNINRQNCYVNSICAINFTNDTIGFSYDLRQALTDIFEKYGFAKINFCVVVGNPIESSYDQLVEKWGGRVVGIFKEDALLFDNKKYDRKFYEIMASDYFNYKEKRKQKEEVRVGKY